MSTPIPHLSATIFAERNEQAAPERRRLLALEPTVRDKTWGEKKFNTITYIGAGLLGNEAASLAINNLAEDKHGNARGLYAPFKRFFTNLKHAPEYVRNGGLPKVLISLLGGMLMVPVIKYLEDHKGELVRSYDRAHYGEKANTDPALIEAHREMDEAPKQSWGSLWKSRAVTVAAAIGVDSMMGWKDAPSTKLFSPNSRWSEYSSMDRIANKISEKTLSLFKANPASHPNAHSWLQRGSWLLILSSSLTALFYVSAKLFAKKRDEKIETRYHRLHPEATPPSAMAAEPTNPQRAEETPVTKIRDAEYEATLHAAMQAPSL